MWPVPSSSHARKRPTTRAVLRARASSSCGATGAAVLPSGLRAGSDALSLGLPPLPPACGLSTCLPSVGLPLPRRRGGESGSEEADLEEVIEEASFARGLPELRAAAAISPRRSVGRAALGGLTVAGALGAPGKRAPLVPLASSLWARKLTGSEVVAALMGLGLG